MIDSSLLSRKSEMEFRWAYLGVSYKYLEGAWQL